MYAPPQFGAMGPGGYMPPMTQGSLPLGICAGFFGGCIGLILVLIIAKGPQTKKGAWIGFAIGMVLGVIANLASR
jgi:hypothetical protein